MDQTPEKLNCIECKQQSHCFQNLIPEELEFISQHKVQINYQKGETLSKEGAFTSSIMYILKGYVKLILEGPDRKNIIVMILKSGDYLGFSSIFGRQTYYYSATALTETLVCSIDKDSLKQVIYNNGKFSSEVIKWLCINYEHIFAKLSNFGFKHLHGRLADVILYLNQEPFLKDNLFAELTRKDIAELAGMPTESAVRILSEFAEDDIIQIDKKIIEIKNLELLQKISRGG